MDDWKEEFAKLQSARGISRLKRRINVNLRRDSDFYGKRKRTIDKFFEENPTPIDIALMLYKALLIVDRLAYHLEENSLLAYRPKASHERIVEKSFLEGVVHPERTLLLFDGCMDTGAAIREAADFFMGLGYDRRKIFGYLDYGYLGKNTPELMQVEGLLKR
ncbi:MAG: hypothetical protein PHF67_00815 [Candidatus Nanoarchaeia archaeon]|nr:hypothetical protein [Candidatus Nanoarchaeia archaeon]